MSETRPMGRALALLLTVALLVTGCASDPSPSLVADTLPSQTPAVPEASIPTPSLIAAPSAIPTPLPSPVTGWVDVAGGTVAAPGGASVTVPNGALKKPATATIAAQAPPAGPTDEWPADAVGAAWSVDLGGGKLKKPITLTIPYDPAMLPAGQDANSILLAYRDGDTDRWIPVPSTVDPVAHTVTASVTHLSIWGTFTINWDYWIAFIGKVASANLTDLLEAVQTLTTECETSDGVFKIDNGESKGLLKGCLRKVVDGEATIGVTSMRAVWLAVRSPADGGDVLSGPGDTIAFKTGGAKLAQPVVASARMTDEAFWYQLADLLVRLLPGGDELTKAGTYTKALAPLAEVVKRAWAGTQVYDQWQAGDTAGMVEDLYTVLTSEAFLADFAYAVVAVGQEYRIPRLKQLTPRLLSRILLAANLVVLIGTLVAWDIQFLFGPSYGEVRVKWLLPPRPPRNARIEYLCWDDPLYSNPNPGDGPKCPEGRVRLRVTWQPATGSPSGYRIYWVGAKYPLPCEGSTSYAKPKLVGEVAGARHQLTFTRRAQLEEGSFVVEAFNNAGPSKAVATPYYMFGDSMCEP